MIFDELQERYGPHLAETIRQTLTLEEFKKFEIHELLSYFEKRSEDMYEAFVSRQKLLPPENGPLKTQEEYLGILRRRWEEAEELAYLVLRAEQDAAASEDIALEA